MLAVLFWVGLLGYAMVWSGIEALGTGVGHGIIEVLDPAFVGELRKPGTVEKPAGGGGGGAPGSGSGTGTTSGTTSASGLDAATAQRIAEFHREFMRRFPGLSDLGQFSCRRINHSTDPSDPWSEHAWGRARDYGGSAQLIARATKWICKVKARYKIDNVIHGTKTAPCVTVPGGSYPTLHVGWGRPAGTPPCARGQAPAGGSTGGGAS